MENDDFSGRPRPSGRQSYLLRGICMHNLDPKSGGKCGNDYVYIFPGVGTAKDGRLSVELRIKFIILNTKSIVLNAKFIIFNTKC